MIMLKIRTLELIIQNNIKRGINYNEHTKSIV